MTTKDCLGKTQTVCDRHILSLSLPDKGFPWQTTTLCDRHRLSVTETDCLYQTLIVCDRQRLYVTDTAESLMDFRKIWIYSEILSPLRTLRHRLSVTDTYCMWQTQTVCDIHRLSVTDRDCLSQTRLSVTDTDSKGSGLSVTEAHNFYHWHF